MVSGEGFVVVGIRSIVVLKTGVVWTLFSYMEMWWVTDSEKFSEKRDLWSLMTIAFHQRFHSTICIFPLCVSYLWMKSYQALLCLTIKLSMHKFHKTLYFFLVIHVHIVVTIYTGTISFYAIHYIIYTFLCNTICVPWPAKVTPLPCCHKMLTNYCDMICLTCSHFFLLSKCVMNCEG